MPTSLLKYLQIDSPTKKIMKHSNLDKIDPLLTKLRVTGETHIAPRSASKPTCTTDQDLLSRSKQRRDYLQSSYNELKKYAVHDKVVQTKEDVKEYRGTSYRTRQLWDFDNEAIEPSAILTTKRMSAEKNGVWTAKDVRREARQSVTRQVQRDLLEMEEFNEGMKRRIAQYSPVLKKNDNTKKLMDEKREADEEAARLELKLNLSNEENRQKNFVDDGYGKILSRPKAAPLKGPYMGINSEAGMNDKSEEYVSISEARLQRIRELNKQNYEDRASQYAGPDLADEELEKKISNDSMDEIMPPPPRYLSLFKEKISRTTEYTETPSNTDDMIPTLPRYLRTMKEKSHSQPELTDATSSRPPFSPPTRYFKSRTHAQSLSPPRRPLTTSRLQISAPPTSTVHQTINGSPSSFYVSTNQDDGNAASVRSALSDGTPGQRSSSSRSNNVAQTTLSVILGRIEDAKENFKKALVEEDVKKQAELASLITRLGEAAVAMRKLEDL